MATCSRHWDFDAFCAGCRARDAQTGYRTERICPRHWTHNSNCDACHHQVLTQSARKQSTPAPPPKPGPRGDNAPLGFGTERGVPHSQENARRAEERARLEEESRAYWRRRIEEMTPEEEAEEAAWYAQMDALADKQLAYLGRGLLMALIALPVIWYAHVPLLAGAPVILTVQVLVAAVALVYRPGPHAWLLWPRRDTAAHRWARAGLWNGIAVPFGYGAVFYAGEWSPIWGLPLALIWGACTIRGLRYIPTALQARRESSDRDHP